MGGGEGRSALIRWVAAAAGGVWVAVFGWAEPGAAILGALITAAGLALLPERPRAGAAAVLGAGFVVLAAGAPWGQVDMMLPLAVALFAVGRTERAIWPGLLAVGLASLCCAARDGLDVGKLALMGIICTGMWLFGVAVRRRALDAHRAIAEARRLAAEDPAEAAARLAAQDRARLAEASVTALQSAIVRMQSVARMALGRLEPAAVREVHGCGVDAVDELRGVLDLLRDQPTAGDENWAVAHGPSVARNRPTRQAFSRPPSARHWTDGLLVVVFVVVAIATIWFAPSIDRGPELVACYAALAVSLGLRHGSPFAACLVAVSVSLVVAMAPPPSSDLLFPLAIGYVLLAWSISSTPAVRVESRRRAASLRRWVGLAMLLTSGLLLSSSYGHQGAGFVLLLFAGTVLAGVAWCEQDAILYRAETQSSDLRQGFERAADAAVRSERLRLARELHDVASHSVGGMVMQAGAASVLVERAPNDALDALRTVVSAGDRALSEVTVLRSALTDTIAGDPGPLFGGVGLRGEIELPGGIELRDEIERLAAEARARGVAVRTSIGPLPADAQMAEAFYHVVREGLVNAERYAPGGCVEVSAERNQREFLLRVRDTGVVAAPRSEPAVPRPRGRGTGHGLTGLAERIGACGGRIVAHPEPSGGFLLEARVPAVHAEGVHR